MRFLAIFKNNFLRYAARSTNVIMMLFMTILTVLFAILFTAKLQLKGSVALVAGKNTLLMDAPSFSVTRMDKEPPMSELMLNKYDAVVIDKGQGSYEIHSVKNAQLTDAIRQSIANPGMRIPDESERGVGANILSYLTFFILLQGVMFMMPYSDDKESGVFRRIGNAPIRTTTYLAAHGASNFLLVFLPAYAVVVAAKLFGANTGFSLLEFAGLLSLISLLSTVFALLVASAVKRAENCSVVGSVFVMLTTMLAGSFINFSSNRPVFDSIIRVLPQKSFLTLVQGVEQGRVLSSYLPQLLHILLIIAALFILSAAISSKNLRKGNA